MQQITVEEIKLFLQDKAENNRMLKQEEFSSELIHKGIENAIDKYNEMPPYMGITDVENFPYRNLLLLGVCAYLYKSIGLKRLRNQLQYSSGGTSINDEAVADAYLKISSMFDQEFQSGAKQLKVAENIRRGWGSVPLIYTRKV